MQSEVPLSISTVAAAVATAGRVEGTGDRVCGDRFRVWRSAAASLWLSFVTRQPYSIILVRATTTSPAHVAAAARLVSGVQVSDRDFVIYFFLLYRPPASKSHATDCNHNASALYFTFSFLLGVIIDGNNNTIVYRLIIPNIFAVSATE